MLVLSRKTDERIMIGDEISIVILETKGNRVRIGIEAPRDMRVLRGELSVDKHAARENSMAVRGNREKSDQRSDVCASGIAKSNAEPVDEAVGEKHRSVSLQVFQNASEEAGNVGSLDASALNAINEPNAESSAVTDLSFIPLQRTSSRLSGKNFASVAKVKRETSARKPSARKHSPNNRLIQILEESRQESILSMHSNS